MPSNLAFLTYRDKSCLGTLKKLLIPAAFSIYDLQADRRWFWLLIVITTLAARRVMLVVQMSMCVGMVVESLGKLDSRAVSILQNSW